MTLNGVLSELYSILNELENENMDAAADQVSSLIDQFEKKLPYTQDSAGDLDPKKDIKIL